MRESINVNNTTLGQFFVLGNRIVIPDYQRRYDWKVKHTEKLVRDLYSSYEGYIEGLVEMDELSQYFIGNLVFYNNELGDTTIEVVDGQQRLTTLFIMYKAIISHLNKLHTNDTRLKKQREHTINTISSYIWVKDELTGDLDYNTPVMVTEVIGDDMVEFKNIMRNGTEVIQNKTNYYLNYKRVLDLIEDLCISQYNTTEDQLKALLNFTYALNKKTILLAINTNTQEMALKIFQTINDSGIQLNRMDILKADIYRQLESHERSIFIQNWNDYLKRLKDVGKDMTHIYDTYIDLVKAEEGSLDLSTLPVDRLLKKEPSKIKDEFYLQGFIEKAISIYELVYKHNSESEIQDIDLLKLLHLSFEHPYDRMQRTIILYYIHYENASNFTNKFKRFLEQFLYINILSGLTVSRKTSLASAYLKINKAIVENETPRFKLKTQQYDHTTEELQTIIKHETFKGSTIKGKALKHLLYVLAYNQPQQQTLLPKNCEVEHILPREWRNKYIPSKVNDKHKINDDSMDGYKECLANKTLLESKINNIASNDFFKIKKKYYGDSSIAMTNKLSKRKSDYWYVEDIEDRRVKIYDELMAILTRYK